MKELNERTALNLRLQEDAAVTRRNAEAARGRQMVRCIDRAYRRSVTLAAVNAALAGAALTAGAAVLACMVL